MARDHTAPADSRASLQDSARPLRRQHVVPLVMHSPVSSMASNAPPPPPVNPLPRPKLNTAREAWPPAGRPLTVAPAACAASSITTAPAADVRSFSSPRLTGHP